MVYFELYYQIKLSVFDSDFGVEYPKLNQLEKISIFLVNLPSEKKIAFF